MKIWCENIEEQACLTTEEQEKRIERKKYEKYVCKEKLLTQSSKISMTNNKTRQSLLTCL